jgi:hypothetical protein
MSSKYHLQYRGLPRELRDQIYEAALCPPGGFNLQWCDFTMRRARCEEKIASGLLLANREMSAEALETLYSGNSFNVCYMLRGATFFLDRFLGSLPPASLGRIQALTVPFHTLAPGFVPLDTLRALVETAMPNVKELTCQYLSLQDHHHHVLNVAKLLRSMLLGPHSLHTVRVVSKVHYFDFEIRDLSPHWMLDFHGLLSELADGKKGKDMANHLRTLALECKFELVPEHHSAAKCHAKCGEVSAVLVIVAERGRSSVQQVETQVRGEDLILDQIIPEMHDLSAEYEKLKSRKG